MCAADHTPQSRPLEQADLAQLRALTAGDWGSVDGSRLSVSVVESVELWGEFYLERPIHSLRLAKLE